MQQLSVSTKPLHIINFVFLSTGNNATSASCPPSLVGTKWMGAKIEPVDEEINLPSTKTSPSGIFDQWRNELGHVIVENSFPISTALPHQPQKRKLCFAKKSTTLNSLLWKSVREGRVAEFMTAQKQNASKRGRLGKSRQLGTQPQITEFFKPANTSSSIAESTDSAQKSVADSRLADRDQAATQVENTHIRPTCPDDLSKNKRGQRHSKYSTTRLTQATSQKPNTSSTHNVKSQEKKRGRPRKYIKVEPVDLAADSVDEELGCDVVDPVSAISYGTILKVSMSNESSIKSIPKKPRGRPKKATTTIPVDEDAGGTSTDHSLVPLDETGTKTVESEIQPVPLISKKSRGRPRKYLKIKNTISEDINNTQDCGSNAVTEEPVSHVMVKREVSEYDESQNSDCSDGSVGGLYTNLKMKSVSVELVNFKEKLSGIETSLQAKKSKKFVEMKQFEGRRLRSKSGVVTGKLNSPPSNENHTDKQGSDRKRKAPIHIGPCSKLKMLKTRASPIFAVDEVSDLTITMPIIDSDSDSGEVDFGCPYKDFEVHAGDTDYVLRHLEQHCWHCACCQEWINGFENYRQHFHLCKVSFIIPVNAWFRISGQSGHR